MKWPRPRWTLKFRLALWYSTVGTVLLLAFGAVVYLHVASELAVPIGTNLRRDLNRILPHLSVDPNGAVRWDGARLVTVSDPDYNTIWFEIWDHNGKLVYRHWPFETGRLRRMPVAPASGRDTISIYPISNEIVLRVLSTPYHAAAVNQEWMIRVMRRHETNQEALEALLAIILFALPLVIAAQVAGGYLITRRWLAPLDQMVADTNRISSRNLDVRLAVDNPHDELGQLGSVFNVTLDRLESAFRDLDRFVGDAAHELRNPLAALRNVGEVGLSHPRTPDEYREIVASMLEEEHRLQSLVQRLLELAGAESSGRIEHRQHVRLDQLAAGCVGEFEILAEEKGQRLTFEGIPAEIVTDPVLIQQALRNLIDNAIKYSPTNKAIRVAVDAQAGGFRVSVTDEGEGIPPEHRARLTERFFRAGRPTRRNRDGFGLGLSITKVYLRVVGGSLHYGMTPEGLSCFSFSLPASSPESGAAPSPPQA